MTTPEARLPVDPTVQLPASVRNAAAVAEAAHKAMYSATLAPADAPAATPPVEPAPAPAADALPPAPPAEPAPPAPPLSAAPVEPAPPAPAAPADSVGTADQEHHRYLSMKGRFEQQSVTLGTMQEQLREMGDELMRVNQVLTQQRRQPQPPPPPPTPVKKLVTQADVDTYGPELIDLVRRTAMETVAPEIQNTRQEVRQTRQRVAATTVHAALTAAVPNWEEINDNPRFLAWLSKPDVYSGHIRSQMLTSAFQAADAPRVLAFFNGFLREEAATGHTPPAPTPLEPATPPRVAAVPLESLAAPGKARPASDVSPLQAPADKPVFTHAQVAAFYDAVRKGQYAGRDADKQRDEHAIILAGREGRIR